MPHIYILLPKHIAHWVRHLGKDAPLSVGAAVSFDGSSRISAIIAESLYSNDNEVVLPERCFCERQWRHLMQRRPRSVQGTWPTSAEVDALAGVRSHRKMAQHEYLRIKLPAEVVRHGNTLRINGQWQLGCDGARHLKKQLETEFMEAYQKHIEKYRENCADKGILFRLTQARRSFLAAIGIDYKTDRKSMDLLRWLWDEYKQPLCNNLKNEVMFGNE